MGSSGIDLFFRVHYAGIDSICGNWSSTCLGICLACLNGWRVIKFRSRTWLYIEICFRFWPDGYGHRDYVVIGVIGVMVDLLIFQRIEKRVMIKWGLEQKEAA